MNSNKEPVHEMMEMDGRQSASPKNEMESSVTVYNGGSENDMAHMNRLGKRQQFTRNYKLFSITAFAIVGMSSWVVTPNAVTAALTDGNTGGAIVMYLLNFAAWGGMYMSLAEMSSMAPTAGGQYHWASEFAPPSMQKFLSYISGWLSTLAWCCGVASGYFLSGDLIMGVVVLVHPDYTPAPYQSYLISVLLTLIGLVINTVGGRYLPKLEGIMVTFSAITYVIVVVVLWVLGPKISATDVFTTFSQSGGWSSLGLAMVAGQSLVAALFTGADSTAHMAEETFGSSASIPKAMLYSYLISSALNFLVMITYCFSLTNLEDALATPTGFPFLEVFASSMGSPGGAAALWALMIIILWMSSVNFMASSSRQVFAFARDLGLPFHTWIAKVNVKTNTPINSVFISAGFTILISLIGVFSNIAFNAIISLGQLALIFTYMITIGSLI